MTFAIGTRRLVLDVCVLKSGCCGCEYSFRRLGMDYRLRSYWNGVREAGVLIYERLDVYSFWILMVGIIKIAAWSHFENDGVRLTGVCACCGNTLQCVAVGDTFTIVAADVHRQTCSLK